MASRVTDHVRGLIAMGRLRPGERIAEASLARELGVSRSPIREALGRLATEGLVHTEPYRGTFVRPLDAARFRELVDFRVALEEFAVRRLAATCNESTFGPLRSALDDLRARVQAADFDGAVDADLAIHERMIALAGNAPLERAFASMLAEFRLYIGLTARQYDSMLELVDEHGAVFRALAAHHADEAVALVRRHILHGLDALLAEVTTS